MDLVKEKLNKKVKISILEIFLMLFMKYFTLYHNPNFSNPFKILVLINIL